MQITIKGRHWKVTPDYRAYAERRIEKLQRYFSHLISAQLTVTEEGYRHLAELRIFGNGVDLTGRAQNPDPRAALDAVLEKQEQALKRRKERLKDRKKRGASLRQQGIPELPPQATQRDRGGVEIVRSRPKQRTLTVDQAVRMLLKSRLTVLAFSEPDGGGMRIAYRLEDGQVGLLELD
ncbi:MAG: ribosome-associated translation inhibitor RaiA [Candidatus Eisenbacteria bacterium]|uniref:Ribosome-associated translation inhibitor RaiA n=1 Tax=Eiseniibacteriota bacterium TaxID=2212470 RepID=A0A538TIZ1_UNCEI|nr:MAG: ribosome-associated translation inhibitor RaiA [Candidatus Eisenbacteria bacterium]TMQ63584.1 MAG: ribosome-associated translation inhibitor RaiA [Candidatus Eisenbacteria bacterium]